MIKNEFDSIDELMQEDSTAIGDYESAKEANDLLMDALKLTDAQKTLLKGSFEYLEDMLRRRIVRESEDDEPKIARIGSYSFQHDERVLGSERRIRGREIIEWIRRNHLEDSTLYCSVECLYARLIDIENDRHYRELRINWNTGHAKYEVIDDILEEE